jgi:4-amino-4-deoxy-L-arabinose transferase-like glycosyltransferase
VQTHDARHTAKSWTAPYLNLRTLLALGLVIHFGFGYLLTLSVDEAHYVMYAAIPAWSYFDHPPLVGWIQWPLVVLGAPDGIIRLIPQLLWLAACLLARKLAFNYMTVKLSESHKLALVARQSGFGPSRWCCSLL